MLHQKSDDTLEQVRVTKGTFANPMLRNAELIFEARKEKVNSKVIWSLGRKRI